MSSSRRGRSHHDDEEHEGGHERWLVTYADMVTLLMVLFIVMFAMSSVDQKKFMALKNGLAAGFANSASVLPGSTSLLEEQGSSPIAPVAPAQAIQDLKDKTAGPKGSESASATTAADTSEAQHQAAAASEVHALRRVQAKLLRQLKRRGLADDVSTAINSQGLVISLVSHHVEFKADEASLTPRGAAVIDALGPVLLALPEKLEIAGHTNQVAVQPKNFATDWDLSAARAVTVLRRLNEQLGLPEERLSLAAYGDTMPLEDPSLPGSQEVNKRVDIVVLSASDERTRELVQQLATTSTTSTTSTGDAAGGTQGSARGSAAAASGTINQEGTTP